MFARFEPTLWHVRQERREYASSAAIDRLPVWWSDVVIHRAGIESERPSIGEVVANPNRSHRHKYLIELPSDSGAHHGTTIRHHHIGIYEPLGTTKHVGPTSFHRWEALVNGLPLPFVRSEKKVVLERPSVKEPVVSDLPIVGAPSPRDEKPAGDVASKSLRSEPSDPPKGVQPPKL